MDFIERIILGDNIPEKEQNYEFNNLRSRSTLLIRKEKITKQEEINIYEIIAQILSVDESNRIHELFLSIIDRVPSDLLYSIYIKFLGLKVLKIETINVEEEQSDRIITEYIFKLSKGTEIERNVFKVFKNLQSHCFIREFLKKESVPDIEEENNSSITDNTKILLNLIVYFQSPPSASVELTYKLVYVIIKYFKIFDLSEAKETEEFVKFLYSEYYKILLNIAVTVNTPFPTLRRYLRRKRIDQIDLILVNIPLFNKILQSRKFTSVEERTEEVKLIKNEPEYIDFLIVQNKAIEQFESRTEELYLKIEKLEKELLKYKKQ